MATKIKIKDKNTRKAIGTKKVKLKGVTKRTGKELIQRLQYAVVLGATARSNSVSSKKSPK
ncbi:MAG: hypothetical protein HQL53_07225 [Magnetococcales bacterium]|nr:hypothetical protein [Magnetococcales bacterium]